MCSGVPETPTTPSSPANRLPLGIVRQIIAHLIYDKHSLLVCSLTCRSWYTAAVPHLHHTLNLGTKLHAPSRVKWPNPLLHLHKLGLLPLVEQLHIHQDDYDCRRLSPQRLHRRTLPTLSNLQELHIEYLNIPKFVPKLQRYFGHFSPTLRSLTLTAPKGTNRQIIYFIGLFQYLDDLELKGFRRTKLPLNRLPPRHDPQEEPIDCLTPSPPFIPPLRGQLTMRNFWRAELLKDMISLFGGLRFHSMDLERMEGVELLWDACEGTLETWKIGNVVVESGW